MVEDRVTDGVRIAELLSSELHGRTDGVLAHVAVGNADRDVEPTVDGTLAYDIAFARTPVVGVPENDVDVLDVDDGGLLDDEGGPLDDEESTQDDEDEAADAGVSTLASVFVHPDRVRVEFRTAVDVAAEAAAETRLRVRPKATTPPRTLAFVESGAAVKDAADVVCAVVETLFRDEDDDFDEDA